MKYEEKDSFIVVSDLHSCKWALDKIISMEDKYETIYILGDTTDRGPFKDGTNGVEMLFKIMDLCKSKPNKYVYIPGNHDLFVYGLSNPLTRIPSIVSCFENCGKKTYYDLCKGRYHKRLDELASWLGSLRVQRLVSCDSKLYGLAHALFIEPLYRKNPNYNLKEAYKASIKYEVFSSFVSKEAEMLFWYRKGEDKVSKNYYADSNITTVIGHTPEILREGISLNEVNKDNELVSVVCVDGGINISGELHYYDGKKINRYSHLLDILSNPSKFGVRIISTNMFDNYVLVNLNEFCSFDKLVSSVYNSILHGESIPDFLIGENPKNLKKKIKSYIISYVLDLAIGDFKDCLSKLGEYLETGDLNCLKPFNLDMKLLKKIGYENVVVYFNKLGIDAKLNGLKAIDFYVSKRPSLQKGKNLNYSNN